GRFEGEGGEEGSELLGDPPPEHGLAAPGRLLPDPGLLRLPPSPQPGFGPGGHPPPEQPVADGDPDEEAGQQGRGGDDAHASHGNERVYQRRGIARRCSSPGWPATEGVVVRTPGARRT